MVRFEVKQRVTFYQGRIAPYFTCFCLLWVIFINSFNQNQYYTKPLGLFTGKSKKVPFWGSQGTHSAKNWDPCSRFILCYLQMWGIKVQCHFRTLLTKRLFTKCTFKQCWWSAVGSISAKILLWDFKENGYPPDPQTIWRISFRGPGGGKAGPIEEKVGSGSTHAWCDVVNGDPSPFEFF